MAQQPVLEDPHARPGQVLAGKYRVESVLGTGGMGVVVAATHLQLQELVALKFVHHDSITEEAIARFQREGQAAVKLKSEHVARVLDIGTLDNGAPFMVMEYLKGSDLAHVVRQRGPLPVHEVADYVLQACEAIAEAHAIGIIHRDLKPQNLFLTFRVDGRPLVKVLDFGISKFATSANSGEHMALTRSQTVLGTPHYMSPEQLRTTKNADHRTDIWALGVILYELLAGRVPFAATSMTELAAMVLQDTPQDLRQMRTDVPAELCAVIARCLEKDPAARYQSVAALAHQLEGFTLQDSRRPAERILAVARGSSGRQITTDMPTPVPLGSGPQLPDSNPIAPVPAGSDRAVIRSMPPGQPGMTGVTWADTQAMSTPAPSEEKKTAKKSGWVLPVVLASIFGGIGLFGVGGFVAWKATHKPNASTATATATSNATATATATATTTSNATAPTTATATTTTTTTSTGTATATATATSTPTPTSSVAGHGTAKPIAKPAPPGPTTKPPKPVDQDTPADRN